MNKQDLIRMIGEVAEKTLTIEWNSLHGTNRGPSPGDQIWIDSNTVEIEKVSLKKKNGKYVEWSKKKPICVHDDEHDIMHIEFAAADNKHSIEINFCLRPGNRYFIVESESLNPSGNEMTKILRKANEEGVVNISEAELISAESEIDGTAAAAAAATTGTAGHGRGGGGIT